MLGLYRYRKVGGSPKSMTYVTIPPIADGILPVYRGGDRGLESIALEVGELGLDLGWTNLLSVCILLSMLLWEFASWSGWGRAFQAARTLCSEEMAQGA